MRIHGTARNWLAAQPDPAAGGAGAASRSSGRAPAGSGRRSHTAGSPAGVADGLRGCSAGDSRSAGDSPADGSGLGIRSTGRCPGARQRAASAAARVPLGGRRAGLGARSQVLSRYFLACPANPARRQPPVPATPTGCPSGCPGTSGLSVAVAAEVRCACPCATLVVLRQSLAVASRNLNDYAEWQIIKETGGGKTTCTETGCISTLGITVNETFAAGKQPDR